MNTRLKKWLLSAQTYILGVPYLWLLLFLVLPFFIILKLSFSEMVLGLPPYAPVITLKDFIINVHINLNN